MPDPQGRCLPAGAACVEMPVLCCRYRAVTERSGRHTCRRTDLPCCSPVGASISVADPDTLPAMMAPLRPTVAMMVSVVRVAIGGVAVSRIPIARRRRTRRRWWRWRSVAIRRRRGRRSPCLCVCRSADPQRCDDQAGCCYQSRLHDGLPSHPWTGFEEECILAAVATLNAIVR